MADIPPPKQTNGHLTVVTFLNWQIDNYAPDQKEINAHLERKHTWEHWDKWEQEVYKIDQKNQEDQLSAIKQKLAYGAGIFIGVNGLVTFLLNKFL